MGELPPESVQDYPRPPALEPVPQRLRIRFNGLWIADTTAGWRVLETHHAPTYYFPRADITALLEPATGRGSLCEWKGRARYFDVIAGDRRAPRAAWSYDAPVAAFAAIAGHVAFYPGPMEACLVDNVQATPQPGDFYGGWVTPNLRVMVKGAPGTAWW